MKKLAMIQQKLKAPKNQYNDFGKYKYRSCEDILEAVKPLLDENTTLIISDEIVNIGERYYVKAVVLLQTDDFSASCTAYAREPESKKGMDAAQITGSTSSYARKYALNGLFCIDDTKDADFSNKGETPPKQPPKDMAEPNYWDELVRVKKDFPDETQQAVLLLGLDLKGKLPKDILPADCDDIVKEVHRLVDQKVAT